MTKPRIFLNKHRLLNPYWPADLWVCEGDGVVGFGMTMMSAYYTWLARRQTVLLEESQGL